MEKSQYVREVYRLLQKLYPNPVSFLNYNSPYQLMVAVILSAQTTDAQVNKVTPLLFRNYPDPKDLMISNLDKVEIIIRSTGFYKVKAHNIIGAAEKLVLDYNSEVPENMDELLTIPGIGRKSANVIRAHCYNKPAIIFDTHFSRVTGRIGLTDSSNPDDILQYSEYLFRNCGVEAWVQAAEILIGALSMRINSFDHHGDKTEANHYLEKALELQAEARLSRSSSHTVAVSYYKKSVKEAKSGLNLLEKVNPYTRGRFWVGIGIFLLAAISLIISLALAFTIRG